MKLNIRRMIPLGLTLFRVVVGPLLFLDALDGQTNVWFLAGFTAAILSDIFDGIIARRIGAATPIGGVLDGWADIWFYVWFAAAIALTHPAFYAAFGTPLLLVAVLQVLGWVLDWIKFRSLNSYHAYSTKAFGLGLFVASFLLIAFNTTGLVMMMTMAIGVLCKLEEIAITCVIPAWQVDVPSVFHAYRIRQQNASAK